ncbi:MAG: cell division protein FtsA [Deltaproteobacteria bacterium]|jgi:cell division protein FtsA|nr:cell division protein FtsA [Deltaproteobacteria bacterium]
MSSSDLLVGLDIGTTKICCLVGEPNDEGGIDIRGMGTAPSAGMRKGMVVNIDKTVASIRQAVELAQRMAGCVINSAYLGVAGGHINSFNTSGMIAVENKIISNRDISRVHDTALALSIPMDREVLHTITQEYKIDDQPGIIDPPIGMNGSRLEVQVHVITGAINAVQNLISCALQAGLEVNDIVLESVASAEAVLTPEERQLGVALIDLGGGTTDIAIYSNFRIRHTAVLSMGGGNLTNDLALSLRISFDTAEKLKIQHGCCVPSFITGPEYVDVPSMGGAPPKSIGKNALCGILTSRVEEIMDFLNNEFVRSGFDDLINGVVITGGSSLLPGVSEVGAQILERPVRRGVPCLIGGLTEIVRDPRYSTAVGLCLFSLKQEEGGGVKSIGHKNGKKSLFKWIYDRLASFFRN